MHKTNIKNLFQKAKRKVVATSLAFAVVTTSISWPIPAYKVEAAETSTPYDVVIDEDDGIVEIDENFTMADYINEVAESSNKVLGFSNEKQEAWTADPYITYFDGNVFGDTVYGDAIGHKIQLVPKEQLNKKIIFAQNRDNEEYKANREGLKTLPTGYHVYDTNRDEFPVLSWRAAENVISSHSEAGPADSQDAENKADFHGFPYITADSGAVPCMADPYDKNGNPDYTGDPLVGKLPAGNSTAWRPTCAWCEEELNINFYGSQEAWERLPSLTMGSIFFYSCRVCGGMEQASRITHTCKGLSVNKYIVNYDDNTNDPGCTGNTASQSFFMDRGELQKEGETNAGMYKHVYEGLDYYSDDKVARNGYARPGYVFTGWNTAPDGSGTDITEGSDSFSGGLLAYVQDNYTVTDENGNASIANNTEVTLYAQWSPKGNAECRMQNENSNIYN